MNEFFGIDFGTTSSAVVGYIGVNKNSLTRYLCGDDAGYPVPSIIAIDKNTGEIYSGRDAWKRKGVLSESCVCISSIKSILDSEDKRWDICGRFWTPVDVAAELFRSLIANVKEKTSGSILNKAVVAIPIGFTASKRESLRKAAKKAGLEVESFISEPTAAFFANYGQLRACSNVAVFDWGGGTLDVSILENRNGKISELATGGIDIAGDYIDNKIARRIHNRIATKKGYQIEFDSMPSSARDEMIVKCEEAKRNFEYDNSATIRIINYGEYGVCTETIDYKWFREIVEPEVKTAMKLLEDVINQSGIGVANIDKILLVGGSSKLRPLIEAMVSKYGPKVYCPEETMWNIGDGAAQIAKKPGQYYTNQNINIELYNGGFLEILSKDQEVKSYSKTFTLGVVDTSQVAKIVFSGSSDIERSEARYKTLAIPSYNFLEEGIEITAEIDDDLVFRVFAASTMKITPYRIWEYSQLKCYYKI